MPEGLIQLLEDNAPTRGDPRTATKHSNPMVRVSRVSKLYGQFIAVDDLSFEVEKGAFLTVLGPSGSGKTTLLKMIAGFLEPTSGEIWIDGKAVSAVASHKRSIGMVFQRLALFPHMTVGQNIAFPLKMRRFPPQDIPGLVDQYLLLVKLAGFSKRRVDELSGGQQQRVAIARALVFSPSLLLLDEPLAALDKELREEMEIEFRRIQQELHVTTINVTHDQRSALVTSDQILVMNQARAQQIADPREIYVRPGTRFVASFIGLTNFMQGRIVETRGSKGSVRIGEVITEVRLPIDTSFSPGAKVEVGLRAEKIVFGPRIEGADIQIDAVVEEVIFEGRRVIYVVRARSLGNCRLSVDGPEISAARVGGALRIGWRAKDLMIFQDVAG